MYVILRRRKISSFKFHRSLLNCWCRICTKTYLYSYSYLYYTIRAVITQTRLYSMFKYNCTAIFNILHPSFTPSFSLVFYYTSLSRMRNLYRARERTKKRLENFSSSQRFFFLLFFTRFVYLLYFQK